MEILEKVIKKRKIELLTKMTFPNLQFELTAPQFEIVKYITFGEHKRVCINAMTRYGKSQSVAIGICLYILLNKNKRVALIAPTGAQAEILRNYIADLILQSPLLMQIIELERRGKDKMKKEASRTRQTFSNGCEYRVYSAAGEAERLMGFGANTIVIDEACLIPEQSWAKITRMLGDNPDDAVLIELANPWDMATRYYQHWTSSRYENIHIDYKQALKEGRVTQEFIDEQREEMTDLEFTVLYESDFPTSAEDSLFDYKHIQGAYRDVPQEMKELKPTIMGVDVARMGNDLTVCTLGYKKGSLYVITDIIHWGKKDTNYTTQKILDLIEEYNIQQVNLDICGLGAPIFDRLNELSENKNWKIKGCDFGSRAEAEKFSNKKSEQYFRLRRIFELGNIIIKPSSTRLTAELLAMKWAVQTGSENKRVIDPNKSPDFADALVYTTWEEQGVILDW